MHPPCRRKKLRSARPALRAGLPPLRSFLLSPRGKPRGGPAGSCPKKTGRARSKRKALRGNPKMTSPGHFGGHVHAERLWAVTLRLSSGSRWGAVNVSAFRRVWGFCAGKAVPDTFLSSFAAAPWRFRKRAVRQRKEKQGRPGAPVPVVPWQNGSWSLTKQSVNTGTHPPPPESPKKSHGFFGPGMSFSSSFFFDKEKEGPPCGQHPPPRARHVLRRHQPAYPPSRRSLRPSRYSVVTPK